MSRIIIPNTLRTVALSGILIALAGALFLVAQLPSAQAQTLPAVPNLAVAPVTDIPDSLDVSWSAPTGVTFNQFQIRWKTGNDPWTRLGTNVNLFTRSYRITGLAANTLYVVEVTAMNGASEVAKSEASATTSQTLVSNMTEAAGTAGLGFLRFDRAQGFRTGSNPDGYILTSVELDMSILPSNSASFSVAIHTPNESGNPGSLVDTVLAPQTLVNGANRFTPEKPLKLDPSTRYFVVIDVTSLSSSSYVRNTSSKDEDGAAGWIINNGRRYRDWDSTGAWTKATTYPMKMRANGVNNTKPEWIGDSFLPINQFQVNQSARLTLPAATGDEPLTYSLLTTATSTLTLPAGMTFDAETRTISGTPTEAHTEGYQYTVTDADGDAKSIYFLIAVEAASEFSSLSVTPAYDALEVTWTRASDGGVTGYLVQWKSGDQEYETWDNDVSRCQSADGTNYDCTRTYLAAATASSYTIANLPVDTLYTVRVTQLGGSAGSDLCDHDNLSDLGGTCLDGSLDETTAKGKLQRSARTGTGARQLTVVRGGPAQTYPVRLNQQPPVGVAVYPTHDLEADYAWYEWDSGVELDISTVLRFFTRDEPTSEEAARSYPPKKWDTNQEIRVSAPPGSTTGTVTLYHGFIWDDDAERTGYSVGDTVVTVVDPGADDIVVTISSNGEVSEGDDAVFTVTLSKAAPTGGLTVVASYDGGSDGQGQEMVTFTAGATTKTFNVATAHFTNSCTSARCNAIVAASLNHGATYVMGNPWYAWVGVLDDGGSANPGFEFSPPDRPSSSPPRAGAAAAGLTGLAAASVAGEPTHLAVSWDPVEGAAKYVVRHRTGSDDYGQGEETTDTSHTITGLTAATAYTVNVVALTSDNALLAEAVAGGTTENRIGGVSEPPPNDSPSETEDATPAAVFMIYHDPDGGAAALNRYNEAVKLLTDAGIAYSEVVGDVQADVDRLAGVTNSVMPRFFLGDPTDAGWTSQPKANNGGLRWLKAKVAELSGE